MSDPVLPTTVRIRFQPYSHQAVNQMLHRAKDEFGLPGQTRRWWFQSPAEIADANNVHDNVWILDFHFQDRMDAMMFALKYQI